MVNLNDLNIPFDEQVERAALGAMLRYDEDVLVGRDLIALSDFYLDNHKTIYRAIVCMSVSRKVDRIDLLSLGGWMQDEGTLDGVGGYAYLMSLDETWPVPGEIRTRAARLRELANRRALLWVTHRTLTGMMNGQNAASGIEDLEATIAQIRAEGDDDLISASEAVDRVNASLQPDGLLKPISTGIAGLDDKTLGGIRPGEMWTVGGLPGRGKSSLARQIADHVVRKGVPTMISSLEMTVEQWAGHTQTVQAGIEPWKLREIQYLSEFQRNAIEEAGEQLRDLPLYFDDSSIIHIDRLIARARIAVMRRGIQLLVVDYAQRVGGNGKELRHRVGDVAAKLAAFAKANRVAVLLLSQLRRPTDINARPTMGDLKESGDIEAHSHTVVLCYQPVDRESEKPLQEQAELIVGKQRFGPLGAVPVRFDPDWLQFADRHRLALGKG